MPEGVPAGAAAPGVRGPGAAAVRVAWVEGDCARRPRPAGCGVAGCADAEGAPRRWGDGSRLRAAARAEGRPAGGMEAGLRAARVARPGVAERPVGAPGPAPESGGRWAGGPFAAESCTPGRGMGVAGEEEAGATPPRAEEGWRRAGGPIGVAGSLLAAAASPWAPSRGPVASGWVGSWCGTRQGQVRDGHACDCAAEGLQWLQHCSLCCHALLCERGVQDPGPSRGPTGPRERRRPFGWGGGDAAGDTHPGIGLSWCHGEHSVKDERRHKLRARRESRIRLF